MSKVGFVTIVGKPNSGKSTLLNSIIGKKIAIATPRKNTTRNQIKGIYNKNDDQIIFIDTPGFLKTNNKLDERMHQSIINSLQGVDLILFLLPFWKKLDMEYLKTIELLEKHNVKKYLILTKIDKAENQHSLLTEIEKYNNNKYFDKIIPISALKNKNMNNLLLEILKDLPNDEVKYYDENQSSDSSEAFYVSEIIREKALFNLNNEVPHKLFVKVERTKNKKDLISFRAEIIVNRESLKGIIIGKNGSMIKKIGSQSRYDLERYFEKKVFLDIFVKIRKDWEEKESIINEIEEVI